MKSLYDALGNDGFEFPDDEYNSEKRLSPILVKEKFSLAVFPSKTQRDFGLSDLLSMLNDS